MSSKIKQINIHLPDVVGAGYRDFWHFKGRFRVCKGSRASKKSKTTALWFIYNLTKHTDANLLVVRRYFGTLKDSCFIELKWAIKALNLESVWKATTNPLEIKNLITGQKVLFRGFDDPLKITSISVDVGYLCWCWIEEAYEIKKEEDFKMLNESIRGEISEHLFKQITLTFNPWNERIWLKKRFFDLVKEQTGNENGVSADGDIFTKTTNYLCNEFLDKDDKKLFEDMEKYNPKRYKVAGLGNWGISEGQVFENYEEREFDIKSDEFREAHKNMQSCFGLDFGYTNDPSALFCGLVDLDKREIYVFDEMYKKGLVNSKIYKEIERKGYVKEKIIADCAEPKSIAEIRNLGVTRIKRSKKGKDSPLHGIQKIQDYKIIIHPRCTNFSIEISNYTWDKDDFGNFINKPIGEFNHLMDAMRYAFEDIGKIESFSFD